MKLKSKYVTLVALILVTATPRAFDQLADLKNFAQQRFRAELLNIFWNLTPPETRRGERPDLELLARAQTGTPACDASGRLRTVRAGRAASGLARTTTTTTATPALDMGHRPPADFDEPLPSNLLAFASTGQNEEPSGIAGNAPGDRQEEEEVILNRTFKDYPLFDETATPVTIDNAVAQVEWVEEDEAAALPEAQPAVRQLKDVPRARRFTRQTVPVNFQVRLPDNLNEKLIQVVTGSDALIKTLEGIAPARTKCRVRVRVAPETPPVPEKPALIS